MKRFLTVIQVLLLCVFLACGGYLAKYFYDLNNAKQGFDDLRKQVNTSEAVDASDAYTKFADDGVLLKYDELYKQNNDLKGWIKIDGTVIDYPVVQGRDNEYYLSRDFYGKKQSSGIPFIDFECNGKLNTIIYAHNMKDGSMFAELSKYNDKSFFDLHNVIVYDTLTEHGEYEIFSVFKTTVGSSSEFKYYEYTDLTDMNVFNEYVTKVKAMSIHKSNINPASGDEILTLSTCAYNTQNERLVVVARKKKV